MRRVLHLKAMHGLGDNIHQRWPIRCLMKQYDEVRIETPWFSVYHDLVKEGLVVLGRDSFMRTQIKNFAREQHKFAPQSPIADPNTEITHHDIWFRAQDIREQGSVLGAMCKQLGVPLGEADFQLPCDYQWFNALDELLTRSGYSNPQLKPIMIYRPLVNRPGDWGGCMTRNPDQETYAQLYESIRDQFYVISVADLEEGKEWSVDARDPIVDLAFNKGELSFESMAALFTIADLVYCSPGFAVILGQAVNTPVCCVFGGYENSKSFSAGAKWSAYLGIDPINSCQCFLHSHDCKKAIDIPLAKFKLGRFVNDVVTAGTQVCA